MTAEAHLVATTAHGRYLVDPAPASAADRALLVGFHGYAENAEIHLEGLRRVRDALGADGGGWTLCAVQGLHRFYNKAQQVVASWMTSQDREAAIADNAAFVAAVIADVERRYGEAERLVFTGFSQGVAMAYRAAVRSGHACHGVMALAGDVPPEVAALELPSAELPAFPPVLVGRGREDAWYTAEKMEQDLAALARLGAPTATCVFDGGHVWAPEFSRAAADFLTEVRRPR